MASRAALRADLLRSHLSPAQQHPARSPAAAEEGGWAAYRETGLRRALSLGNRGPIRFDAEGRLAEDIVAAYNTHGFYVFEGVLSKEEVDDLAAEFEGVLDNAPVEREGTTDKHGRPCRFPGYYSLNKPSSSDLFGGKADVAGRLVAGLISHPLMMMDSALRCYGHPQILRVVESIHGPDFVPMNEAIFHKAAGEGAATPWHQDGRTHWTKDGVVLERPDGTGKKHGFNFSVSWPRCTPENCLWVVPGSQRRWRLANGGRFPRISERLAGAVPAVLNPGDCVMVNRSSLHGAFPNTSPERRVTMVLSFHQRDSCIGAETTNVHAFKSPGPGRQKRVRYDAEMVEKRARMIALAIDARRQRYPDETAYVYRGKYIGGGRWDERARREISKDGDEYWQRNLTL